MFELSGIALIRHSFRYKNAPFLVSFSIPNCLTLGQMISSAFWAISHFSKYVKRGAIHIDSVCDVESVKHVAFVNPDGEYVVVLVNAGGATEISLEVKGRYAHIPVSESSMMTLIF